MIQLFIVSQMICSVRSPLAAWKHGCISLSQEMDVGDTLVIEPDERAEERVG